MHCFLGEIIFDFEYVVLGAPLQLRRRGLLRRGVLEGSAFALYSQGHDRHTQRRDIEPHEGSSGGYRQLEHHV